MDRAVIIANSCLRNLAHKTYYNLHSIEREIGSYARALGISYCPDIIRNNEEDASRYVYYCQFRQLMKCKAAFCAIYEGTGRPFKITINARHTHSCNFEPIEMDLSPFDIDPSQKQEEPVQLSEEVRRGRQFFQKALNFLALGCTSKTLPQYRRIFESISMLTFGEGIKLFDALQNVSEN